MFLPSNECLFIIQSLFVAGCAFGSLFWGVGGLTSFVAGTALISNLLVRKQVTLFGLDVVTCDSLAIGSDLAIHLLYEYYGKKAAEKAIQIALLFSLFFVGAVQLFLAYIPNSFDVTQAGYQEVFGPMSWIIISSCCVALFTKIINISLYHLFSRWWKNERFLIKTILALMISQLFDTVAFTVIALSGTVHSMIDVIIFSYAIKCLVIISGVPLVTALRRYLSPLFLQKLQERS